MKDLVKNVTSYELHVMRNGRNGSHGPRLPSKFMMCWLSLRRSRVIGDSSHIKQCLEGKEMSDSV
jgi:hypothetical protein